MSKLSENLPVTVSLADSIPLFIRCAFTDGDEMANVIERDPMFSMYETRHKSAQSAYNRAARHLQVVMAAGRVTGWGYASGEMHRRQIRPDEWSDLFIKFDKNELRPPTRDSADHFPTIRSVTVRTQDVVREAMDYAAKHSGDDVLAIRPNPTAAAGPADNKRVPAKREGPAMQKIRAAFNEAFPSGLPEGVSPGEFERRIAECIEAMKLGRVPVRKTIDKFRKAL